MAVSAQSLQILGVIIDTIAVDVINIKLARVYGGKSAGLTLVLFELCMRRTSQTHYLGMAFSPFSRYSSLLVWIRKVTLLHVSATA